MSMRARTSAAALLALLAAGLGGCSSKYVEAVSAYSKVSGESARALSSAPKVVGQVCRQDAQRKFLKQHLPATAGLPADEKTPWRKWYDVDRATESPSLTWRAYCGEIDAAGQGFLVAIDALAAHAKALSSLAGEQEYDGSDLEDLVKAAGRLANSPRETPAGKAIGGVAGPVAGLGKLLLNDYKSQTIKQYARAADAPVGAILAGLARYVAAADALWQEAEKQQGDALARLEAAGDLYKDPVDPLKLAQFYAFAVAIEADGRDTRAALAGFRDVIAALQKAQAGLARAGDDERGAKAIAGTIAALASNLSRLKAALAADEG